MLIASALSQAQALMQGKSYEMALNELIAEGYSKKEAKILAVHKTIPGNRPSNILFLDKMNPFILGELLALYEHKTYVQSIIWGINAFDQWGVELGKQLLTQLLSDLQQTEITCSHDASTRGLIEHYKKIRDASKKTTHKKLLCLQDD
jgi:glucose-6-phosphate isomerase